MRKVALDLGVRKTTYCEVKQGQVVQRATVSGIAGLEPLLGMDSGPAVVVIEACREAWHVHDVLQEWGNEVVLVDTTRSRQLGIGRHGRKTDRIDAEVLARALESGSIPKAHVLSPHRRELRRWLNVRRSLVESRAHTVTTVRGLAREQGLLLPRCATPSFVERVRKQRLSPELAEVLEPLLKVLEAIPAQLERVESKLTKLCESEPVVKTLATTPGIGPVVAAAFVSVIDDAGRFHSAHHVESYLGLVPSENSSGGKQRLGAITKKGNPYLRALLVQSAWGLMRDASADDPLRSWGKEVANRRGKKVAIIAVARRLVGVLWAMWRRGYVYEPALLANAAVNGTRRAAQSLEHRTQALARAAKKLARKPSAEVASAS